MKAIFAAAALVAGVALAGSAAALTPITGLYNTGTDATNTALVGGNGLTDTHYVVQGAPSFNAVTYKHDAYIANDSDSRWVSLSANGEPGNNTTTYRFTFDLSNYDASTASLSGDWGADNEAIIFLNGVNTGVTLFGTTPGAIDNGDYASFQTLTHFAIASGFVSGVNTLDFQVTDLGPPGALRVDNLAGSASLAVPEPASWALMIVGFGGVGAVLRRRRSAVAFA